MLYVQDERGNWQGWHVGEPLPDALTKQRVVTIQADCDELDLIIYALKPKAVTTHELQPSGETS